jgi:hypothetical protein
MLSCPAKQGLIILVESTISSSEESSGSGSSRTIRIVTPFSTVWAFFFWEKGTLAQIQLEAECEKE